MNMLNFCRRHDGAVSVFLTLILIPTFIFGGVIIDGSRIMGAKNLISGAGDLAMNGALSDYYEELNQVYGLLAMADTAEEMQDVLQEFFEVSLNAGGVEPEDFSKALVYLELTGDGFLASDVVDTEIYQTEVIKQEILEYMKYRAPVTLTNRLITDKLGSLENLEKEKKAADGELKFESSLNDLQQLFDDIKELTDRQEEIYRLVKDENGYNRLLSDTESKYDKIALLATTKKILDNCSETESGDTLALMKKMSDLTCNLSNLNADTCSSLIKMRMIQKAMASRNTSDILKDLDKNSDEYKERKQLIEKYESALENLEEGRKKLDLELKELVEETYELMHEQRVLAEEGRENCIHIQEKLEELRREFESLRGKYENWKNAVSQLPEGDSKKAYEESIEKVSGFFEAEGDIADFEEKIRNNEIFYKEVCEKLDQVTIAGRRIDWDIKTVSDVVSLADGGFAKESSELTQKARQFMEQYNTPGLMNLSVVNKDISQDAFVVQLKEFYCNTDGSNKAEADKAADAWGSNMDSAINDLKDLLLCTDLEDLNVETLGQGDLPTDWLGIGGGNAPGEISMEGGIKDKESRKKASNKGSDNLNADNESISEISSLGSKISKGAEWAVEPLIITEYVMGMFSHNTSNWNENAEEISDPLSINRSRFNTNQIYRAEIEYILWGSPDIRNNVRATKAVIFTVNLICNMSFAFTNQKMRSDANMIASLFPVGPMAKTAIKCALQSIAAMIQTTSDMLDLMKGKRVALLKTESVWDIWINPARGIGGNKEKSEAGFTYEDYLWILVCVNMYNPSGQQKLLARTADIIELNLTESKAKADHTLKDKYTMIQIEASVEIDTFFMQKLNGEGYDVQSVGAEDFTIPYCGIQGY